MEKEIAVDLKEIKKYGCPYCGYKKGDYLIRSKGTVLWSCHKCRKISHGLLTELKETPFSVKTKKGKSPIKKEAHPFAI